MNSVSATVWYSIDSLHQDACFLSVFLGEFISQYFPYSECCASCMGMKLECDEWAYTLYNLVFSENTNRCKAVVVSVPGFHNQAKNLTFILYHYLSMLKYEVLCVQTTLLSTSLMPQNQNVSELFLLLLPGSGTASCPTLSPAPPLRILNQI